MNITIAGTVNDSIVDGSGMRYAIFVQGCPHGCEGCHNPQTHDFFGGSVTDTDTLLAAIKANPLLSGVTFSGGEPFCQAKELAHLGEQIKAIGGLDIVTYTGFTLEYLLENSTDENGYSRLLNVTDYLIDGRFEIDKKDLLLKFRGSSNQRIIDVKKSLSNNCIIETEL